MSDEVSVYFENRCILLSKHFPLANLIKFCRIIRFSKSTKFQIIIWSSPQSFSLFFFNRIKSLWMTHQNNKMRWSGKRTIWSTRAKSKVEFLWLLRSKRWWWVTSVFKTPSSRLIRVRTRPSPSTNSLHQKASRDSSTSSRKNLSLWKSRTLSQTRCPRNLKPRLVRTFPTALQAK